MAKRGNSRGVFQDKHGTWWVHVEHRGQRIRRKAESKTHAESVYAALKTDLARGKPITAGRRGPKPPPAPVYVLDEGPFTLGDLRDLYVQLRSHVRTIDEADRQLALFAAYFPADQPAGALTAGDVERWLAWRATHPTVTEGRGRKTSSPATANRSLHTIRAAYRLAVRDGLVERDPTFGVRTLPEAPPRVRYLTYLEQQQLAEQLVGRDWRIVLAAMYTGLRRANVFGLRWDWIDWDLAIIVVPTTKPGRRHVAPMSQALRAVLQEQRREVGDSPWVWPSPRDPSEPLKAEPWIVRAFEPALERAKIRDFHFHDLRHTTGSRATMAGHGLVEVKEMLGQTTTRMAERYSHLAPGRLHAVAESVSRPANSQFNSQFREDADPGSEPESASCSGS